MKEQYMAKMWLMHSACYPLQLIRKLYYRKVEVAFLSKGNVPTSEKWGRDAKSCPVAISSLLSSRPADMCPLVHPAHL